MTTERPLTRGMRGVLLLGSLLVLLAGIQLFVLSEETDRWFAWTITPPLTAAFLGAFYWTALTLAALSARESLWVNARVGVVGVLVFVSLTLITTLMHLDRFHFDSPSSSASFAAWAWLLIYVLDPLLVAVALAFQMRAAGVDPQREHIPPRPFLIVLGLLGGISFAVGAALFLTPEQADVIWPWALSPLTARASASWLIGMGIILGQSVWERDWYRIRSGLAAALVLAILQSIALVRYSDTVVWDSPTTWGYIAMLVAFLGIGLWGTVNGYRLNATDDRETRSTTSSLS